MFNGRLNSNIIFGILLILAGISIVYHLWLSKPDKGKFKGKIPLIVTTVILVAVGLFLLVSGIVYAIPGLTA